jgi:hypothetical protein
MMRRRIARAFAATVAAGATITTLGFTAAGAASAAAAQPGQSRPVVATTKFAGYEGSGRDFRYVAATIRVPDSTSVTTTSGDLYPQLYVQLSNGSVHTGDTYTQAGIEPCALAEALSTSGFTCPIGVSWVGYIEAFDNSILGPFLTHFVPLNVDPGDGVNFSIYFNQAGNSLHYVITPPTPQSCSTGPNNECFFTHTSRSARSTITRAVSWTTPTVTACPRRCRLGQTTSASPSSWLGP